MRKCNEDGRNVALDKLVLIGMIIILKYNDMNLIFNSYNWINYYLLKKGDKCPFCKAGILGSKTMLIFLFLFL